MTRWYWVVLILWIAWVGSMVGARLFPPAQTEVIFFQVGQGDATLLRSQGQTLFVDVGPRVLSFDAGQRLLAPQLRSRGITEIDALVLTHPDLDHIGGLRGVRDQFRIHSVWINRTFQEHPVLLRELTRAGIDFSTIRWIDTETPLALGSYRVTLFPPQTSGEDNDRSIVIRADGNGVAVLLTGDLDADSETLLPLPLVQNVDLLKAGHHGAQSSTSDWLLDQTRAAQCVFSVGRTNPFGHPAPETLRRLELRGIRTWRTDRNGTTVCSPRPNGWSCNSETS